MTLGSDFPPISANFELNSKVSKQSSFPPPVKRNANDVDVNGASVWNKPKGSSAENKTFAQILRSSSKATNDWKFRNVNKSLVDGADGKREFVARKSFSMVDGKPTLIFNEEECDKLDARLGRSLICKFPTIIPNFTFVKHAFERLRLVGGYTYGPLGPKHLLLNLELEEDYSRLWHNGTLNFLGIANGTVFKWTPEFEVDKEPPVAPIWIALPKLPLRFCHRECFMEIGKFFGKPLRIDDGAALLSRPALPRILVEVNVLEPKLEHIQLATTCKGRITKIRQPVVYEDWPAYCSKCCVFGHGAETCVVEKQGTVTNDDTYAELATYHNQRVVKKGTFKARFTQPKQPQPDKGSEATNSFNVLSLDTMAQETPTVTENRVDDLPVQVAQQTDKAANTPRYEQQKRITPTPVKSAKSNRGNEKKIEQVVVLEESEEEKQSSEEEETHSHREASDEKDTEDENTEEETDEDEDEEAKSYSEIKADEIIRCLKTEEMTLDRLHRIEKNIDKYIEQKPDPCWDLVKVEILKQVQRVKIRRKEAKAARMKSQKGQQAGDV